MRGVPLRGAHRGRRGVGLRRVAPGGGPGRDHRRPPAQPGLGPPRGDARRGRPPARARRRRRAAAPLAGARPARGLERAGRRRRGAPRGRTRGGPGLHHGPSLLGDGGGLRGPRPRDPVDRRLPGRLDLLSDPGRSPASTRRLRASAGGRRAAPGRPGALRLPCGAGALPHAGAGPGGAQRDAAHRLRSGGVRHPGPAARRSSSRGGARGLRVRRPAGGLRCPSPSAS